MNRAQRRARGIKAAPNCAVCGAQSAKWRIRVGAWVADVCSDRCFVAGLKTDGTRMLAAAAAVEGGTHSLESGQVAFEQQQ